MISCVLTADIGSTSLKCALMDNRGNILSYDKFRFGSTNNNNLYTADLENGFYKTVKNIKNNITNTCVEAICISGNGPTSIPLDSGFKSDELLFWYDSPVNSDFANNTIIKSFFLPHIILFKKNNPQKYNKTCCFMTPNDWLLRLLGAEPVTSIPSDLYKPYYYDAGQCRITGIDINKFPIQIIMGTIAGVLSAEAAKKTELTAGIPLVAGTPDFISAIIGSGTSKPGMVCDRTGRSEGINMCIDSVCKKKLDITNCKMRILPHVINNYWNLSAVLPDSGNMDEFCRALDSFKQLGLPIKEMTISGGQGVTPEKNRIKSDLSGCIINIPENINTELTGNAILAYMALGKFTGLQEGIAGMTRIRETVIPNTENKK